MARTVLTIAVFGVLSLVTLTAEANAQGAAPPIGVWAGRCNDGHMLLISVYANGTMGYEVQGGTPIVGRWTWNATSTGGVITLHYSNAGYSARAYYSVTYLDQQTIMFSDPYFHARLQRQL